LNQRYERKRVQILHIGSYSTVSESWEKILEFMKEKNLTCDGVFIKFISLILGEYLEIN